MEEHQGIKLIAAGQYQQAADFFQGQLTEHHNDPIALNLLGLCHIQLGLHDQGLDEMRQAFQIDPTLTSHHINLVKALRMTNHPDEAENICNQILAIDPKHQETLLQLIRLLYSKKDSVKIIQIAPQFLKLDPNNLEVLRISAQAYISYADHKKAAENLKKILALEPNDADALMAHSYLLLAKGNMEQGWHEHEARFKANSVKLTASLPTPKWDGSPLDGRHLLLIHEQGLGDTIMFIRYVKLIKKKGGIITVATLPELIPLLTCIPEIDHLTPITEGRPPQHDVWLPIMSLPFIFHTTLRTVPKKVPYIALPKKKGKTLPAASSKYKVGICWQGSSIHKINHHRSIPFEQFSKILNIPDVQFYSFQFDNTEDPALLTAHRIIDIAQDCHNFLDTAEYLQNVDLLISVDTALVHVAGAINIPVWNLISKYCDWRWMENRTGSPWYPSMHLFRQKTLDNWDDVLNDVSKQLQKNLSKPKKQ